MGLRLPLPLKLLFGISVSILIVRVAAANHQHLPTIIVQTITGNTITVSLRPGSDFIAMPTLEKLATYSTATVTAKSITANNLGKTFCRNDGDDDGGIRCQSVETIPTEETFFPVPHRTSDSPSANLLLELSPFGDQLMWSRQSTPDLFLTNLRSKASVLLEGKGNSNVIQTFTVDWFNGIIFCVYTNRPNVIWYEPIHNRLLSFEIYQPVTTSVDYNSKVMGDVLGLSLDPTKKSLYWTTQKAIMSLEYGENSDVFSNKLLLVTKNTTGEIKFINNLLFWIEGGKLKFNVRGMGIERYVNLGQHSSEQVTDFVVYENKNQGREKACRIKKCSHVCLPLAENKARCACPAMLTLNSDELTCEKREFAFTVTGADKADRVVKVSEIWPQNEMITEELANISTAPGFLLSDHSNRFCFVVVVSDSLSIFCTGKSTKLVATEFPVLQTSFHQVIHVSIDIRNKLRVWLSTADGCLKFYDSNTPFTLPCVPGLQFPNPVVVIDDINWQIFWQSANGSVYRGDLWSKRVDVLISHSSAIKGIALNPAQHKMYYLTYHSVNVVDYDGGGTTEVWRFGKTHMTAYNLTYFDGNLYWVESWPEYDNIVTLDLKSGLKEQLYRESKGSRIGHLAFPQMAEVKVTKNACSNAPCSHYCVSGRNSNYRCHCPDEYPILLDNTNCTNLRIVKVVSSVENSDVWIRFTGGKLINKTLELPVSDTVSLGLLFSTTVGFNETMCWISNTTGITCRISFKGTTMKTIAIDPWEDKVDLLGLSSNGNDVYWSRQNNTLRCLSVTSLKTKNSLFDFICNDFKNPFAIDSFRQVFFWCNEAGFIMYRTTDKDQRDTRIQLIKKYSKAQCAGLAVDEFKGSLFAILGQSILKFNYSSLKPTPKQELLHQVTYPHISGLQYYKDHLFWIGGENRMGEFIEILYLKSSLLGSDSVQRIGSAATSTPETILQFQIYEPPQEPHLWQDPCAENTCPDFCFVTLPLPPSSSHNIRCPCTNYSDSHGSCGNPKRLPPPPPITSQFDPSVIYGSILAFTLTALVVIGITAAFYIFRTRKLSEHMHSIDEAITSFLNGDESSHDTWHEEGEQLSNATPAPFTAIIPPEEVQVDEASVLGAGQFGTVNAGICRGEPVAIKSCIAKPGMILILLPHMFQELRIMSRIDNHENILRFIGAQINELRQGNLKIITELSQQGPLDKFLRKHTIRYVNPFQHQEIAEAKANPEAVDDSSPTVLQFADLFSYAAQIASGMYYLETQRIVHGNLAARNILVFHHGRTLKLRHFGSSRHRLCRQHRSDPRFRWAPAETLSRGEYSPQSDVWSYGITLWEVFTLGKMPFDRHLWNHDFITYLSEGGKPYKPELATDEIYRNVMTPCWHFDPRNRPTFQQLDLLLHSPTRFVYNGPSSWSAFSV